MSDPEEQKFVQLRLWTKADERRENRCVEAIDIFDVIEKILEEVKQARLPKDRQSKEWTDLQAQRLAAIEKFDLPELHFGREEIIVVTSEFYLADFTAHMNKTGAILHDEVGTNVLCKHHAYPASG